MADLPMLLNLNVDLLQKAADDWELISRRLQQEREGFQDAVSRPLAAEDRWSGDDAKEAARACDGIQLDMEAVAKEAGAVQRFLNNVTDGDGEGFGNLRHLQRDAIDLQQEAIDNGLTVDADGTVRWVVMRAPGPLSPEEQRQQSEKDAKARGIEQRLKKVLRAASDIDDLLTRGLKVTFGTEDTFRTENRNRVDKDDAGLGDRMTEAELVGVRGYLMAQGWDDASSLLDHFLEGSGDPVEVDANRMLSDMPAFQRDVDTTLQQLKSQPDGSFTTEWQGSRPNISEGDKSLNWYYALNNFQYRLVGHKQDGKVTYQVEVQKRYDWGIPSEHRRNLDHSPVHLEQSEVARLNYVGLAKDFDVHGRTSTKVA